MRATRRKGSSETWRAILFGRQALAKGLIKRIGLGESINIWTDNWIAGTTTMKPICRLPDVPQERVSELFLPDSRQWDEELVRSSFTAPDAEEILKLKPGARLRDDIEAWAFEKHGLYSVRSCYRMLKHESDQLEDFKRKEPSSTNNQHWWKKVWKLKVPPKVRIFWWRVLNNFLPSKAELKRRHIAQEDHCETCGSPEESLYHVVVSCTLAGSFWQAVRELTGCKFPSLHPGSWATDLLSGVVCTLEQAALFICGAWSLWTGRNGRVHGRTSWNHVAAAKHVTKMMEDLICLTQRKEDAPVRMKGLWKKPGTGWIKVNTDAAFDSSSGSGSSGVVIRNENGEILMAAAKRHYHTPDALTAEALAARDGLVLVHSGGFHKVILETDNLELVNLLQSVAGERSQIAGLWHEISEISKVFSSISFSFVRREGNGAAHQCAKLLPLSIPECVWSDGFPALLVGTAENDCNLASE
jgi:ribonuclease HI